MTFNFEQLMAFRAPYVFNPWGEDDELDAYTNGSSMRLARLTEHFDCTPRFLLIGEAPGYQGCHYSGVPFTNEKLLLEGKIPRVKVNLRITQREKPWSEPSATIVWQTLHELGIAECTVMWNAFAWHPFHTNGNQFSNRTPTTAELALGKPVLQSVISHFSTASIIAVGRIALETLTKLDVKVTCAVRHPAFGGATAFREGMKKVEQNL